MNCARTTRGTVPCLISDEAGHFIAPRPIVHWRVYHSRGSPLWLTDMPLSLGQTLNMTMTTTQRHPLAQRRRRPFGVTVIAVIQVVSAIAYGVIVLSDLPDYGNLLGSLGYFGILGPILGLGGLPIAFGLLRLKRWAWVLTMLWAGLNLVAALLSYYNDEPNYVGMALSVVAVYYLNQREVQAAFNVPVAEGWPRE